MFMLCAMALVLRTDKAVEHGGSVLQNVSKQAPPKTPATPPATPAAPQAPGPAQTNQPAAQQPVAQQPAQQTPAGSQPASTPPKKP
jgi:hypothetical protein